jgi:hypothetical protein
VKIKTTKKTVAKTVAKKAASKAVKPAMNAGRAKASANGNSYKPGSLLDRCGGMVPTVELSKRAASKIS